MFVFKDMAHTLVHGTETMTVAAARDLMREKDIRHLPVTDAVGKLVGIVSDRDIRSALPSDLLNTDSSCRTESATILQKPLSSLMTKNPVCVYPFNTLQDVLLLMQRYRVGALPVVDEDGMLQGIVAAGDMLRAFIEVMGIHQPGTLLCVLAPDRQGEMKKLVDTISDEGISTGSILVAKGIQGGGKKAFFPYLLTNNVARVKQKLIEQGFEMLEPVKWYLDQLPQKK